MATGSSKAVYAALFGNLGIAITKFIAAAKVVTLMTMHLSPTSALVGIEINLIDGLNTDKVEKVTDIVGEKILSVIPDSKKEYIFIESVRWMTNQHSWKIIDFWNLTRTQMEIAAA